MIPTYCWRCQIVIPMLEEAEWREIEPLLRAHYEEIQSLRLTEEITLAEARTKSSNRVCARFEEMTGFKETNPDAIWHHQRSNYGINCPKCERPFRSPNASFCVECGYGKSNQ